MPSVLQASQVIARNMLLGQQITGTSGITTGGKESGSTVLIIVSVGGEAFYYSPSLLTADKISHFEVQSKMENYKLWATSGPPVVFYKVQGFVFKK